MNAAATVPAATPARPAMMQSASADLGCSKLSVDGRVYHRATTDANPGPNPAAAHAWERCGLGVAPYRLIGTGTATYQATPDAPVQPGGSCDYCGQGISVVYSVKAACGSIFRVGCDCVAKVCDKRDEVAAKVDAAARKHRNALAGAARARRDEAASAELAGLRAANVERLAALPHPRGFAGKSALDWLDFMLGACGATGRAKLIKELRSVLA